MKMSDQELTLLSLVLFDRQTQNFKNLTAVIQKIRKRLHKIIERQDMPQLTPCPVTGMDQLHRMKAKSSS